MNEYACSCRGEGRETVPLWTSHYGLLKKNGLQNCLSWNKEWRCVIVRDWRDHSHSLTQNSKSSPPPSISLLWSHQIKQFIHLKRHLYISVSYFTRLSRQRSTLIGLGIFIRGILKCETNFSESFRIALIHGTKTDWVQCIWHPRQ